MLGIGSALFGVSCLTCQRWWGVYEGDLSGWDRLFAYLWSMGLLLIFVGLVMLAFAPRRK